MLFNIKMGDKMKKVVLFVFVLFLMHGCSKYSNMQISEVTHACHSLNDVNACCFAAKSYEDGKYNSERNRYSLAHLYYSKACDLGNKEACKKKEELLPKAMREPVN